MITSSQFQDNGVPHITVAPYHPASNVLAEEAVQTFTAGMRKIHGDSLDMKIARFVMAYIVPRHIQRKKAQDAPRPSTTWYITSHVTAKQVQQKQQHGQTAREQHFDVRGFVYISHYSATERDWKPGAITGVTNLGPVSYRCQMEGGGSVRKHVDQLRESTGDTYGTDTDRPPSQYTSRIRSTPTRE